MIEDKKIEKILIDDIIPNRFQPRLKFDEKALNNLADSIRIHGIIQPLVLRKINDKYEIIAGERRYKASQIVGLKDVPAIVIDADDNKSAELAVIENLQRKDLTAIEEARSFKKLLDRGYLNQEELAKKLGVSQSSISNKLRLLNLPEEVQTALLDNRISERHARSLLALKEPADQIYMLDKIINNRLTVKQTDMEINKILQSHNNSSNSIESTPIENISDFLNSKPIETEEEDDDSTVNTLENTENVVNDLNEEKEISDSPSVDNLQKDDFDLNDLLRVESPGETFNVQENNNQNEPNDKIDEINKENEIEKKPEEKSIDESSIMKAETTKNEAIIDNITNQINPFQEGINENLNVYNSLNEEPKEIKTEKPKANKDLITVINNTRNSIKNIEKSGFEVETEEFDFEDMYQIIIKIKK